MQKNPKDNPDKRQEFYINGLTVYNTRTFCRFYFEEFLHKVDIDTKNRTFNIYLLQGVDVEKGKKWRNYFGKNFKIIILNQIDLEDLENA